MAKNRQQPGRRRHVPQRTCVACRRVGDKRTLIRIVRLEEGRAQIDPTGKMKGRGAYLCRARPCWDKALKNSTLNRALKMTLLAEDLATLKEFAASLPLEVADSSDLAGQETAPSAPA